ncbi:hypothetical protein O7627_07985 [Solwaraspora sp. WMMD1047]|uniref:hypothetical protein n=1 Tax=Solwaraspora sp. WMMD1047 TaxID=3016102 RepID=UPI0024177724|nr:hypothetical protein [Solwaraspora sp. WMMD1047]MDG4829245.1 hypothetical protein [Solwaraspora sp. WMMD1047]
MRRRRGGRLTRRPGRPGHRAPARLTALLAALTGALTLGAGPGLGAPARAQDAAPPTATTRDAAPPTVRAHGADAPDGTNYRTVVTAVTPAVPGLTVRAVEAGARLELTNRTGRTIEVLGYQGEPYLEVRPDGVYENVHSPATYRNRTLAGDTEPPASADPTVPPSWRQVAAEPVARWHDQRTYWLGTDPPAEVRADPDRPYRVRDWVVPLRDQLDPIEIRGTLEWLPPPDPLLWWAGIVLAALALAALGLIPPRPPTRSATTSGPAATTPGSAAASEPAGTGRAGPAVAATVGLAAFAVLAGVAAITFALLREVDAGATGLGVVRGLFSGQLLPVLAGAGSLVTGAYVLVRRPAGGDFGLALSGACVALFAGVVNATVLARSVAPIGWPAGWARLLVALVIAVGAGVCAAGVLRMWAAVRAGPASAADPPGADPPGADPSGADPSGAGPAGGGDGGIEAVR